MTDSKPIDRWVVEIPASRLAELGDTDAFRDILSLARHVNAFRFGQVALMHAEDDDSPSGSRQRSAAFFYHGGILFEALQLVPRLRVHFGTNPHWDRSFGRFGSDDEIRALLAQGTILHRLRNHVSFHFLDMVPKKSWDTLTLPQFIFARGGKSMASVYYELADTVAIHYLLGAPKSYEDLLARMVSEGDRITKVMVDFAEAAAILIPRVFEAWGIRPRPDDS